MKIKLEIILFLGLFASPCFALDFGDTAPGSLSVGELFTNGAANAVLTLDGSSTLITSSSFTFTNGKLGFTGTSNGVDLWTSTGTFGVADGEQQLFKFTGTTASTSTTQLSSTLWAYMNDNSSGTVTTAHAGALFGRAIKGTLNQDFSFGVEGNCWSNTLNGAGVGTNGACVGVIGHTVWEGAAASTPTATIIGLEARSEITDPTITTARTGNDLYFDIDAVRAETYGGIAVTTASRNYNFYGVVGGSAVGKIVNNGPIMGIPPSAQTITGGTVIAADACGSVKQITAGSAVSSDATTTFSVPSVSTAGTANTGCFMWVVNTGANTITLKNDATFLTYAGEDINLNTAAAVPVFGNGSNWVQAGPLVNTSLAAVYLSSATLAANIAGTGTWGNAGTITLTPGDWDVRGSCDVSLNGATVTAMSVALSAFTGNTTTDHVIGDNVLTAPIPTAANDTSASIAVWREAVASSTSVFIKVKGAFSVATPQAACRISARRIN